MSQLKNLERRVIQTEDEEWDSLQTLKKIRPDKDIPPILSNW